MSAMRAPSALGIVRGGDILVHLDTDAVDQPERAVNPLTPPALIAARPPAHGVDVLDGLVECVDALQDESPLDGSVLAFEAATETEDARVLGWRVAARYPDAPQIFGRFTRRAAVPRLWTPTH
tara:strand:- start:3237 stop:3605 length:369 start_codon:yes stop_codon:yes gene_type:complete